MYDTLLKAYWWGTRGAGMAIIVILAIVFLPLWGPYWLVLRLEEDAKARAAWSSRKGQANAD